MTTLPLTVEALVPGPLARNPYIDELFRELRAAGFWLRRETKVGMFMLYTVSNGARVVRLVLHDHGPENGYSLYVEAPGRTIAGDAALITRGGQV